MNGTIKMNNFLQRMLKKSDVESDGESITYDKKRQHVELSPRSNKSNWMRNLRSYSPSKRDLSPSMKTLLRPNTPLQTRHRNDNRPKTVPEPLTMSNADMPDLEKIIHEFEEGFLSPTKQETKETVKSGRFVKQIVAAFEEKYKAYNDYKLQMEAEKSLSDNNKTMETGETTLNSEMEESPDSMGRTYIINTLSNSFSHYLDSCEIKSAVSSCRSDESINLAMCSFAMDEELAVSTPAKKMSDSSSQSTNEKSIISDRTIIPELPKPTTSKILVRSNSSMRRERQPKIIGAFLKKPVEVEDTSIDWIPITGKKLPRKKSFKRLLSVLTGNKKSSNKSSKLYCSQVSLPEENVRELHDSGYDDKSSSSSSLASLISITDLLLLPENYDFDVDHRKGTTFQQADSISAKNNNKNVNLTTFQKDPIDVKQCFEHDNDGDRASIDDDNCTTFSKRLFLEEVPRSEVRLSLGPSFPLGPKLFDKSSDDHDSEIYSTFSQDESVYDFPEQVSYGTSLPATSPLPKHPFVSLKGKVENNPGGLEAEKYVNFNNNLDKVELRRDFKSGKFRSNEVSYDVPRKYMSKSEPGLVTIGRDSLVNNVDCHEVVYDVPKPKIPQRPRSSVYEDALSLKRRNANFNLHSPVPSGFYDFSSQEEPHYATVKPRNTRICPSKELIRSMRDLSGSRYTY